MLNRIFSHKPKMNNKLPQVSQYKLIVGLGNPGRQYEKTLHNAGFMVIDEVRKEMGISLNKKKDNAEYGIKFPDETKKICLIKPRLFSNLSGEAVLPFLNLNRDLKEKGLLIVYDDPELPLGRISFEEDKKCDNHKGIMNIQKCLQTNKVKRLGVGVKSSCSVVNDEYLLSIPKAEEKELFEEGIKKAKEAVLFFTEHSYEHTVKRFKEN